MKKLIVLTNFLLLFITFPSYANFIGKYLICDWEDEPLVTLGFFFKDDVQVIEHRFTVKNDKVIEITFNRKLINANYDYISWKNSNTSSSKYVLERKSLNLKRGAINPEFEMEYKCKVKLSENSFTNEMRKIKRNVQKGYNKKIIKNKI